MSQSPLADNSAHRTINPRVVLLLVGLIVVISASVIATNYYSPRSRTQAPATVNTDKGTLP